MGRVAIFFAAALLLAGCGPSYNKVISRVRSPDGALDAVFNLYDPGGGATVAFYREVYVERVQPDPNQKNATSDWVYTAESGNNIDLRWHGPDRLLVIAEAPDAHGVSGRSVKVFDGSKQRTIYVEIKVRPPADAAPTAAPAAP